MLPAASELELHATQRAANPNRKANLPMNSFTINGQAAPTTTMSPIAKRILAKIMALKPGEMLTARGLAEACNVSRGKCSNVSTEYIPAEYRTKIGTQTIYGHPKTLAAYRQKLGLED